MPRDSSVPAFDAGLLAQLTALEEAFHLSDTWDLPPQLFLWHPPILAGMRIPERIWQRVDYQPPLILEYLANDWDAVSMALVAQDPVVFSRPPQGVVLVSEGWGFDLEAVKDDPVKTAEYHRAGATGTIYLHPDRIENRIAFALDAHGNSRFMCRLRAGELKEGSGDDMDGRVPDAMKEFLARVTKTRPL